MPQTQLIWASWVQILRPHLFNFDTLLASQITFRAMCKILMSIEDGQELETLQQDITHVCEAMLAFPLRFPWTRFYKGLKVISYIYNSYGTLDSQDTIYSSQTGYGQITFSGQEKNHEQARDDNG